MALTGTQKLSQELQKLGPDALLSLFVLRLSKLGGGIPDFYFHPGTNELSQGVLWQGIRYEPYPAEVGGFEVSGTGSIPRPTLSLANVTGVFTGLAGSYDDLIGVQVERVRTFVRFLDAANFEAGNPEADPTAEFPRDRYTVAQKVMENPVMVQFALQSALDLDGVLIPARQIIRNVCTWQYRGDGCFYNGGPVADENDDPTTDPNKDRCSRRLSGCRKRFGENGILPFGSFPALGLT